MKCVFLGPPGAGKGTQAVRMAEQFGLEHASTGDMFRRAVADSSELGTTVKSYLDGGRLVPDELTARVVGRMVLDVAEDFILDGFPRTLPQAELLEQMMKERKQTLDAVVYFRLDGPAAMERLTGRVMCPECGRNYHVKFMPPASEGICDDCGARLTVRSDSLPDVVEKRLEEYREKTEPLVDYYRQRNVLWEVDASRAPEQVSAATQDILADIRK